jgi:hypothetical protein
MVFNNSISIIIMRVHNIVTLLVVCSLNIPQQNFDGAFENTMSANTGHPQLKSVMP